MNLINENALKKEKEIMLTLKFFKHVKIEDFVKLSTTFFENIIGI